MADFILLMHGDTEREPSPQMWASYFDTLKDLAVFNGGSAIGGGTALRRQGQPEPLFKALTGYIRVEAPDLQTATQLVEGNPVYECGGTVEVRALPRG